MTGRQRIEAAFSAEGSREIPAVICYESVFIRDHWAELTSQPWWSMYAPDVRTQALWIRGVMAKMGQDWFQLFPFCSSGERVDGPIEVRTEGVFHVDPRTQARTKLVPPRVGGWTTEHDVESIRPPRLPETPEEIDKLLADRAAAGHAGSANDAADLLARQVVNEFGQETYPYSHVSAPLWDTYGLWGFEGMMVLVATRPELVRHACQHYLAQVIRSIRTAADRGMAAIWIEDCLTDLISPAAFASLNVPFLRRMIEEIQTAGMKSIYYYGGNPAGKWDLILNLGADALSFEESKKHFAIDIGDVVDRVRGRCTVLGNLDAIGVLQNGTESQLRDEVARQIAAGRRNGSRFIMSLGSPVTPTTPVERVRSYCDLAHELGNPR